MVTSFSTDSRQLQQRCSPLFPSILTCQKPFLSPIQNNEVKQTTLLLLAIQQFFLLTYLQLRYLQFSTLTLHTAFRKLFRLTTAEKYSAEVYKFRPCALWHWQPFKSTHARYKYMCRIAQWSVWRSGNGIDHVNKVKPHWVWWILVKSFSRSTIPVFTALPLSRQKKVGDFFYPKLQAICQTNVHLLIQILRAEHHVWKMNYSTNIGQVSYFVEMPRSNFPDYTNYLTFPGLHKSPDLSLTFPWLWAFSLTSAEFPVVTLYFYGRLGPTQHGHPSVGRCTE